MKTKILNTFKIILVFIIAIFIIVATLVFLKYKSNQQEIQNNIDYVYSVYNNTTLNLIDECVNTQEDPGIELANNEKAVAILEIPKIDFKDIVLEGTTQEILAEGIGLFEHSPLITGNVCLAGHNSSRFFKRLDELETGDSIKYLTYLGQKEYVVSSKQVISETDWSMLENTSDNRITIITCVKNRSEVRLCVQAIEKI